MKKKSKKKKPKKKGFKLSSKERAVMTEAIFKAMKFKATPQKDGTLEIVYGADAPALIKYLDKLGEVNDKYPNFGDALMKFVLTDKFKSINQKSIPEVEEMIEKEKLRLKNLKSKKKKRKI